MSQTDLSQMNVMWGQARTAGFDAKQDLVTN